VAYKPFFDPFGSRAGQPQAVRKTKLLLVQRVEYKRTLAALFEEVAR
jgi:hypothetical protein